MEIKFKDTNIRAFQEIMNLIRSCRFVVARSPQKNLPRSQVDLTVLELHNNLYLISILSKKEINQNIKCSCVIEGAITIITIS